MTSIRIVHTSDEHSHIKRSAQIAAIQNDLLLSSGDSFEGASCGKLLGSAPTADLMNRSSYRACGVGNHDFDSGAAGLKAWTQRVEFPLICNNVIDAKSGAPLLGTVPSQLFEVKGVKVGITGCLTPTTKTMAFAENVKGLEFQDPSATTQREVDKLKAEGATVVVVLSHLEHEEELELAERVSGVDVILGGHTHVLSENPESVKGTPILHPGCYQNSATVVDLTIDAHGHVAHLDSHPVQFTDDSPRDPRVQKLVAGYEAQIQEKLDQPVGIAAHALIPDSVAPNSITMALNDVMLEDTKADFAFINQGFGRSAIPAGKARLGTVLDALPLDNRVVSLSLSADQITRVLDDSFSRPAEKEHLGFTGNYLATQNISDRKFVLVDQAGTTIPGSTPVKVATSDYIAQGGLGYLEPGHFNPGEPTPTLRDALVAKFAPFGD